MKTWLLFIFFYREREGRFCPERKQNPQDYSLRQIHRTTMEVSVDVRDVASAMGEVMHVVLVNLFHCMQNIFR